MIDVDDATGVVVVDASPSLISIVFVCVATFFVLLRISQSVDNV